MAGPSFIRGVDQIDHEVKVEPGEWRRRAAMAAGRDGAGRAGAGRGGHGGMDHARHGGGDAPAGTAAGAGRRPDAFGGMNGMEGMFMPSDVTAIGADRYAWKSSGRLFVTDADGREIEKLDTRAAVRSRNALVFLAAPRPYGHDLLVRMEVGE